MSIKTKIALMILAILAAVAGAVGFFSKRDVERAVFVAEQRAARNVLHLVDLDVQGRHKSLLMERLATVRALKTQLTSLNAVVLSGVDRFRELAAPGASPKSRPGPGPGVDRLPGSGPGAIPFRLRRPGRALAYPEKEMVGADLSVFTDVKGRKVTASMREEARRQGSASTTYYWKRIGGTDEVRNFGLFTSYPAWDWMLGAAVDIEDIERAEQRKLDQIVGILSENLDKVTIAHSGFVACFPATAGRSSAPRPWRRTSPWP
jgi:sigma-B regulation protein RsbU (phosphoserine phosphatase)